jgi:hypothetical protein
VAKNGFKFEGCRLLIDDLSYYRMLVNLYRHYNILLLYKRHIYACIYLVSPPVGSEVLSNETV